MLKIDARNIDFEVEHFHVHEKTRRKTPILKLQSLKVGGSLARNARFEAPTCLVSILWFSPAGAVSIWGKLQHLSLPKVSKALLISFCVAGVALVNTWIVTLRQAWHLWHWVGSGGALGAQAALGRRGVLRGKRGTL